MEDAWEIHTCMQNTQSINACMEDVKVWQRVVS